MDRAIFALHPVGVETVAWISERKNLLSTLFYFLALSAYLTYWPLEEHRPRHANRRPLMYVAALLFFILALLSKTVACTLPATLLILVWWKTGRVSWRRIAGTLPMFLLGPCSDCTPRCSNAIKSEPTARSGPSRPWDD